MHRNFAIFAYCLINFGAGLAKAEVKDNSSNKNAFEISDGYVHSWTLMPEITGTSIWDEKPLKIKAKRGEVLVTLFIGSWCIPCQNLLDKLVAIDRVFSNKETKIIYIFSNDIAEDARGFAKEYKIPDTSIAILADKELKKNYKFPVAPSVYISDKNGFMAKKFTPLDGANLLETEQKLWQLTAI